MKTSGLDSSGGHLSPEEAEAGEGSAAMGIWAWKPEVSDRLTVAHAAVAGVGRVGSRVLDRKQGGCLRNLTSWPFSAQCSWASTDPESISRSICFSSKKKKKVGVFV